MKKSHLIKGILTVSALLLLTGCGSEEAVITPMAESTPVSVVSTPEITAPSGVGKAEISEIMSKNKATLMDDGGTFPDWVEIKNLTEEELDIENWQISDSESEPGMILKGKIESGKYAAFFVTGFGLSEGDTVYLIDAAGNTVDTLEIVNDKSDISLTKEGFCYYPTPGRENTREAYSEIQAEKETRGPLVINEVCVENFENYYTNEKFEYTDWVEIKNISDESVNLSDYRISDDGDNLEKFIFPDITLSPGRTFVLLCDKNAATYKGEYYMAPISLDSTNDRLYLSSSDGTIVDYTPLKDIPYGCTYGRMSGENGFFYFDDPTPENENINGKRYVSETPVSLTEDGVFNDVDKISIELEGNGTVYYTLDGKVPDESSDVYTSPIEIDETTIVRAVNVEEGGLKSRALTLSFIVNEGHTLPVVSVVSDKKEYFYHEFDNGYKLTETPGVISYYGDNGSFTMGAGIKMHGDTSLLLPKKNMSFRFRGCYGDEELDFDLFGDGRTKFTNLLLRSGQEQNNTIVRGEAVTNLLSRFSDSVVYQRSRYCILYVDGEYRGIYSIKDKLNEQMYADLCGVSKSSVEMNEATVYGEETFYQEVISPVLYGDMEDDQQFAEATKYLDLQSLIDWTLIEGWTGNYDLAEGNLRYVKSTENDGKWRLCLYDLDCAFADESYIMNFVLIYYNQISSINTALLKNANYRTMMLERASEVFGSAISDDAIIEELEKLAKEIEPEIERDEDVSGLGTDNFNIHLERLEQKIRDVGWTDYTIKNLCEILNVTDEEKILYFGEK